MDTEDEFIKRLDMLSLAPHWIQCGKLSFIIRMYELVFSTYISMIKNDPDEFFMEKEQQGECISNPYNDQKNSAA